MSRKILTSLTRSLGKYHIRKESEFCFKCPRCGDNKFRLEVNLKLGFNCFHCGWQGSVKTLLIELGVYENSIHTRENSEKVPVRSGNRTLLPVGFSTEELPTAILTFFIRRNLIPHKDWGYCKANFKMMDRLVIPIKENGEVVCWVARAVDGQEPKELSPPSELSNKSHYVYGLDDIQEGDKIVIVEGIFDCERLKSYGYKAISILGSHISDIQVGKILAKNPGEIYIMLDGDEAGRGGARYVGSCLVSRARNLFWKVIIVRLPEGKDPDELTKEEAFNILLFEGGN